MHTRYAHLALVALLLVGCAAVQAPTAPPSDPDELNGSWRLTSGQTNDGNMPIPDDHPITLTINGTQIGGSAACNSYGGRIVAGAGGLRIDSLSQTEMACEEPAMAAEFAYMTAIGRVRELVRDGDELVARGEGVELRFDALPAPPTSEMVDTEWTLETLLTEGVASSPSGEPATLHRRSDGTITGSTGCRTFRGTWTENGEQILAPSMAMDEENCAAGLSQQDQHIVSVIGDGFVPSIEGNALTLVDPGGVGLVYRADE